jgi:hypothetical protein
MPILAAMPSAVRCPPRRLAGCALLLAAAAVIAAPAAATAAPAPHAIVAGPIPIHGYELTVSGIAGSGSLTVALERDRGTTTQTHLYTVTTGVHTTTKRIRASLGAFGAIDLRLVPARRPLPAGCRDGGRRVGTWTGSLRLVPDRTYFHTIRATRLPGSELKDACEEPGGSPSTGPQLTTGGRGRAGVTADARTATVLVDTRRGPARVVHLLRVASTLQAAADLTTATLTPAPGGSAITGTATFTGSTSAAGAPGGITSVGTLGGTLTAHFDSIGAVTVGPSVPATLEQLQQEG